MPELKTKLWAEALMRRARLGGAFAYLLHHGDDDAGIALIKVCLMDGRAMVWAPERDENYRRIWVPQSAQMQSESEADAWIARARRYDRDLWVIEVEDPKGRHFLLPEEHKPLDQV